VRYGFLRGLSTGVFLRGCAWMSVPDNNIKNHEVVLRELSWLPGNKLARFSAAETLEPAPVNLENVTQKLHSMKTPPGKTQSRRVSQCLHLHLHLQPASQIVGNRYMKTSLYFFSQITFIFSI